MKTTLILLLAVALAGPLRAITIGVSNLDQPVSATTYAIGKSVPAFDVQQAVSFTAGPGAFNLQSVTLSFYSRNGNASDFSVALYSGISASGPTGLITTFSGNATPSTGLETYTPSLVTPLVGGATYWLVESAITTPALSGFSLKGTNSLTESGTSLPGWGIGDFRMVSTNGGSSWFAASPSSGVLQFSVQVAAVPDSGASIALFGIGFLGMIALRQKLHRRSEPTEHRSASQPAAALPV